MANHVTARAWIQTDERSLPRVYLNSFLPLELERTDLTLLTWLTKFGIELCSGAELRLTTWCLVIEIQYRSVRRSISRDAMQHKQLVMRNSDLSL